MGGHPEVGEHKTYLLTTDIAPKMRLLRHNGLHIPSEGYFDAMRVDLLKTLRECLPHVHILSISMEELATEILTHALRHAEVRNSLIVSTCPEIAVPRGGTALNINRIVDVNGQSLGIGPRPGYPFIRDQVRAIAAQSSDRPVTLVEDGTFTGSTLIYAINAMKRYGVKVTSIVCGFAFPDAIARIKEHFTGEITTVRDIGRPLDWMPDHDFYPLIPNSGKVIGSRVYGEAYPLLTMGDVSYSIPYISPFGPICEWASIPQETGNTLSRYCLHQARDLYTEIERINKRGPLHLQDLTGILPRISVPISHGASDLPPLDARVLDIISDASKELC